MSHKLNSTSLWIYSDFTTLVCMEPFLDLREDNYDGRYETMRTLTGGVLTKVNRFWLGKWVVLNFAHFLLSIFLQLVYTSIPRLATGTLP